MTHMFSMVTDPRGSWPSTEAFSDMWVICQLSFELVTRSTVGTPSPREGVRRENDPKLYWACFIGSVLRNGLRYLLGSY